MDQKICLLDPEKICDDCGECTRCDLDPNKLCDNCMQCLRTSSADYLSIEIDEVLGEDGEMFAPTESERAALGRLVPPNEIDAEKDGEASQNNP